MSEGGPDLLYITSTGERVQLIELLLYRAAAHCLGELVGLQGHCCKGCGHYHSVSTTIHIGCDIYNNWRQLTNLPY